MEESAILGTLKSIENHVGMTAGLTLAIFMLAVAILVYEIVNSSK